MPFQEVIGHEKTLKIIRNALIQKSLPHAYLFYGIQGVGKFKVAISLAKALLCERLEADFCGTCSACRRIEDGNHPDVYSVRPGVMRSGEGWCYDPDNGMIVIDQIRDMQRWISLRSFEGGYRISIFDGAERMNSYAANALLKILEEPPPETLLILISPTKTQLLPTIVSRCQKIYYPPLSKDVLQKILRDREGKKEDNSYLLAALSDGSVGKAISMDVDWVGLERKQWIEKLISIEERRVSGGIVTLAEEMSKSPRLQDILESYCTWYRDLLIFKETGEAKRLLNPDMIDSISSLSEKRRAEDFISRVTYIQKARDDIGNRVNPRLALENLFLRLEYHDIT
jgi:DNA polymerase-3 subunit delta'